MNDGAQLKSQKEIKMSNGAQKSRNEIGNK